MAFRDDPIIWGETVSEWALYIYDVSKSDDTGLMDRMDQNGQIICSRATRAYNYWINPNPYPRLSILFKNAGETITGSNDIERLFAVYSKIARDPEMASADAATKQLKAMIQMNKHIL
eukprot:102832_1